MRTSDTYRASLPMFWSYTLRSLQKTVPSKVIFLICREANLANLKSGQNRIEYSSSASSLTASDPGRNVPIGDGDGDDRPESLARPAPELPPAVADPGRPSCSVSGAGDRGASGLGRRREAGPLFSARGRGVSLERSWSPSEFPISGTPACGFARDS